MKIALFGGSFNPPHQGHVEVLKSLASSGNFDEIWVIPCLAHAFEKKLAPFEDRFELCKLAFEGLSPRIRIQDSDRKIGNEKGWSYLTLRHLRTEHPSDDFFWLMGSDLEQEKRRWKNFEEIEKMAVIHPFPRAGYETSPFPEVSSTEIRERLAKGESIAKLVPPEVSAYIQQRGLYR